MSAMATKEPSFTVGIEEEYLLVDKDTRDLAQEPPAELLAKCEEALRGQVSPEFLRSQIEVGTCVCKSMQKARDQTRPISRAHGRPHRRRVRPGADRRLDPSLRPLVRTSSTPTGALPRASPRDLAAASARRLVICGMHVHVGIEDDELRIDLMNQARYFLPHLLALSTSSPFWQGEDTGLKSYRLAAVRRAAAHRRCRTASRATSEYERDLELLVRNGLIEDATKIWWDLRPSARFPTLEMRITDVCTRIEDGVAIAALYRCILRMLYRLRRANQSWRHLPARSSCAKIAGARSATASSKAWSISARASGAIPRSARGAVRSYRRGRRLFRLRARGGACAHHRATRDERRPSACVLRRGAEAGRQRSGGADRRGRRHHRGDHDGTRRFEFDSASCLTCLLVRLKRAGHAAIDIECGTGDIGGLVGCKEQSRVGDVLRRTEAPKRCLREQRLGDHRI